ncbi:MAG: cytidine deaminase [Bacteroidota bacterium]
MDYSILVQKAQEAKEHSYSIYSHFRVGAALLTADDIIYQGCNIESSSYSLTICAERTALFKAMSEGVRKFKAIAVTSDLKDLCPPCGACRQVLWDLCGNIDVILANTDGQYSVMQMKDLLPLAFGDEKLQEAR